MPKAIKTAILVTLTAGLIALFLFSLPRERAGEVLALSAHGQSAFLAGKTLDETLAGGSDRLLAEGKAAPYDAGSKTFYVPVGLSAQAALPKLSWSNGRQAAYLDLDAAADGLSDAVNSGQGFALTVTEKNAYESFTVVFTGLPAIVIDMESDTETFGPYREAIANVCVFDPSGEQGCALTNAQAKVSYRGASSRFFAKKSYNLSLYDANGEKNGYPLLGMRQDDEWILKSLFTDPNRIREKLAMDIWNELAAENPSNLPSASMAFCEVFLEDEYLGLYALMTPVDPADYGFDDARDVLYKATAFDILTEDASAYPKRALKENGVKFPSVWRADLWDGMLWYVDLFYKENPAESFSAATAHLNLSNFVDYALFHSFISARDNNFSNTFYITRYDADGGYQITKLPWDLDMTFGNVWSGGWPDMSAFSERTINEVSFPHDMNVLLESYPGEMTTLVQERYFVLSKNILSREHAVSLARASLAELKSSGAMAREQARWSDMTVYSDIDDIERYLAEHCAYLDARIAAGEQLFED